MVTQYIHIFDTAQLFLTHFLTWVLQLAVLYFLITPTVEAGGKVFIQVKQILILEQQHLKKIAYQYIFPKLNHTFVSSIKYMSVKYS